MPFNTSEHIDTGLLDAHCCLVLREVQLFSNREEEEEEGESWWDMEREKERKKERKVAVLGLETVKENGRRKHGPTVVPRRGGYEGPRHMEYSTFKLEKTTTRKEVELITR